MENAKRTEKIPFYIRENRFNSMGRIKPICTVLQIFRPALLPAALCPLAILSPSQLSSLRSFSIPHLCHCSRYRKNREYPITHSQWPHSSNFRFARIPTQGYLKNIPLEVQLARSSKSSICPRQIQSRIVSSFGTILFRNHRCGYDSFDCFRTSRVFPYGLQPQIPWEALLCPAHFQRRPPWAFPGDGAKSRQCLSNHWGMEFLRTYHRETTKHNRIFQNSHSAGCVILQQRHYPLIRRETYRIRHCCQNAQTAKITNSLCPLPRI